MHLYQREFFLPFCPYVVLSGEEEKLISLYFVETQYHVVVEEQLHIDACVHYSPNLSAMEHVQ